MTDANKEVVDQLGYMAEQRFQLELDKQRLEREFDDAEAALRADYEQKRSRLQAQIDKQDGRLWSEIDEHRSTLIQRGKKSFPTAPAIFKLRNPSTKYKVTNAKGVLKAARRLRIMREIADPPKRTWRLNQRKFIKWIENNPGWAHFFGAYVEDISGNESLTIQPNGTYTTYYDNRRVSPPPVKIERKQES